MSNEEDWWREELGRALTVLRVAGGVNQDELASLTGIRASSISDYERGKVIPGLRLLQRLLGGLGLSLVDIQTAQGLIESVKRARLGSLVQPSRGAGEEDEACAPSSLTLDRLALRRDIERVAGATGKDVAQLIRLTLFALYDQPIATSTALMGEDSTNRHQAESGSGPAEGSRGEGPRGANRS
jgi:transcriptional regulator with XRE-family HTH domain